ncbi:MAG: membrane protein insertion efficiency factor YidD [Bryobacterales bacterium]|nr:membrane protein insertion efficiency factor YidD [Bryobacterales bacterium]
MGHRHQPAQSRARRLLGDRAKRSAQAGGPMRELVVGALRLYKRWISPALPSACRFSPTCSEYMMEAVTRYGVGKGVWLGVKRLARCHPFHQGGFDPVR